MKNKKTTIEIPSSQLMAVTAALINSEEKDLEYTIDSCMAMIPSQFKVVEIKTESKTTGNALMVKCPVTKEVVREKNDDGAVSFESSPACLAEWDDVEIDCAKMIDSDLEEYWQKFLENTPEYDTYEDMIKKFIVANHKFFAGRKLVLAVVENMGGGCGGCHPVYSYSLLDANIKS